MLKALSGHRNLVKFYDAFEDVNNVYIVMEYVQKQLYLKIAFSLDRILFIINWLIYVLMKLMGVKDFIISTCFQYCSQHEPILQLGSTYNC